VLKKIAVDLLIYDIRLIDGTVLAQLAKEHQPTTRIIWMAASQSRQTSVGTAARSLRLSLSNPAPSRQWMEYSVGTSAKIPAAEIAAGG